MEPTNELRFAVSDRINDVDVGLKHVPLALLGEFQKDVSEFLRGSDRDVDTAQVVVAVEEGSLALVATGLLAASSLWADMERLKSPDSLDMIDARRAGVVERWQAAARQSPHRKYQVADAANRVGFSINTTTDYRRVEEAWAHVEKYLHGTVVDWGGKTRANVHLEVEGIGVLTIAASQDLLVKEEHNRLYRPALLHVTAEENLITGALRNLRLLAFEVHQPSYDDAEFQRMVERGTQAWKEIPNATEWVENLRGGR